jgi:hypothetical protein
VDNARVKDSIQNLVAGNELLLELFRRSTKDERKALWNLVFASAGIGRS